MGFIKPQEVGVIVTNIQPLQSEEGLNIAILGGIIAGSVVGAIILGYLIYRLVKKIKLRKGQQKRADPIKQYIRKKKVTKKVTFHTLPV